MGDCELYCVLWDVMTCGPAEVLRRFGGSYWYFLQDLEEAKQEINSLIPSRCSLGWLFDSEERNSIFLRKVAENSIKLEGITSKKKILSTYFVFITIYERSNYGKTTKYPKEINVNLGASEYQIYVLTYVQWFWCYIINVPAVHLCLRVISERLHWEHSSFS